jgi:hypothetical protein
VGRPDGLPGMAWPGGRDNLQQLVEQRTPSGVDDVGFNGADSRRREAVGVRGALKSRPRATRAGRLGSHLQDLPESGFGPAVPIMSPRSAQSSPRLLSPLEGHIPQAVEGGPVGRVDAPNLPEGLLLRPS